MSHVSLYFDLYLCQSLVLILASKLFIARTGFSPLFTLVLGTAVRSPMLFQRKTDDFLPHRGDNF